MGGRQGPAENAMAPMLRYQPVMDRLEYELAATRERLLRIQGVQNDIAMDLPPSIHMPDGEEYPYDFTRLRIRDAQQQGEITQEFIKGPPNKTIFDKESPPPYKFRSGRHGTSDYSSGSSSSGSSDLVVRCHSVGTGANKRSAGLLGRQAKCTGGKNCPQHGGSSEPSSLEALLAARAAAAKHAPPLYVLVPTYRHRRLSAFSGKKNPSVSTLSTVKSVTPSKSMSIDSKEASTSGFEDMSRSHSTTEGSYQEKMTTSDDSGESKGEGGIV